MRLRTGTVVGKDFRPPEGAAPDDWCYLVVDVTDEERVAIRLHRTQVGKAGVGDRVKFLEPRRRDRPVHLVERVNF